MNSVLDDIFADVAAVQTAKVASEKSKTITKTGGHSIVDESSSDEDTQVDALPAKDFGAASYSLGSSLSLGNSESARIVCSVQALCDPADLYKMQDAVRKYVVAIVEREMIAVQGGSIPTPKLTSPLGKLLASSPRVKVEMSYGLTLNMGDFQFMKPTLGLSQITTGEDIVDATVELSDKLTKSMAAEVKAIRSGGLSGL